MENVIVLIRSSKDLGALRFERGIDGNYWAAIVRPEAEALNLPKALPPAFVIRGLVNA